MVLPSGASYGDSVPTLTVSSTRAPSLSFGVPLRAVVVGRGESGWLLSVAGTRVSARSSVPLTLGQLLTLVASRRGDAITLRIVSGRQQGREVGQLRAQLGLPENELSLAVVRSAMRSGIALKSNRLRAIYRLVERLRRSSRSISELARSATLLESKGISLDRDLVALIAGIGEDGSGRGRSRHQRGGGDANRESRDLVEAVKRAFRSAMEPSHSLQLFNHLIGDGDHWVVVPFDLKSARDRLSGSIRILIPRARAMGLSGDEPFRLATILVSDGNREWRFGLMPIAPSDGGDTEVQAESNGSIVAELVARMASIGFRATLIDESDDSFDGFSSGEDGDIMGPIDSSA